MDAWILVFLIFDVMAGVIFWGHLEERRREKRHCPICNGASRSEAFRQMGFNYWCHDHREAVWDEFIHTRRRSS